MAIYVFFALQSCSAELKDHTPAPMDEAQVTIRLSLAEDDVTVRTKSASDKEIRSIRYVIADASGEVFDMPYSEISNDLSSVRIGGFPTENTPFLSLPPREKANRCACRSRRCSPTAGFPVKGRS